jgi:putative restriction system protein mrr
MLTISQFRPYVLRLMADGQTRHSSDIIKSVIHHCGLNNAQQQEKLASGQTRAANHIGWACSSFIKAGILIRPKRGTYQISNLGQKQVEKWQNTESISEKDLIGLPQWDDYQQSLRERKKNNAHTEIDEPDNDDKEPPDSIAMRAVQEIEDQTAVEILSRLHNGTPAFFELAVIQLLLAMGYGGKENLAEHVGKTGDGGIDGVIKQDPLGIQNIYIQAKRYAEKNSIGEKEIREFVGALQGQGVERGVFITASSFTQSAKSYARKLLGKVILIDGQELVTLMIRYKVGIQVRQTLEIINIDEDFFDEAELI